MSSYEVSFPENSVIFEEGTLEDTMYYIKQGQVEIFKDFGDNRHVIAILGPGDFFGEMALIRKSPRTATAVSVKNTKAMVFNREQFMKLMQKREDIALKIIDSLILRLKDANDQIGKLIQKNQNALVFDALSKMLQVHDGATDIQQASDWVASQLGMKTRETEAVIRKLIMLKIVTIQGQKIFIDRSSESAEKIERFLMG